VDKKLTSKGIFCEQVNRYNSQKLIVRSLIFICQIRASGLKDVEDINGRKVKTDICSSILSAVKPTKRLVATPFVVSKVKSTTKELRITFFFCAFVFRFNQNVKGKLHATQLLVKLLNNIYKAKPFRPVQRNAPACGNRFKTLSVVAAIRAAALRIIILKAAFPCIHIFLHYIYISY